MTYCLHSIVPRPRPAFRHLQYIKVAGFFVPTWGEPGNEGIAFVSSRFDVTVPPLSREHVRNPSRLSLWFFSKATRQNPADHAVKIQLNCLQTGHVVWNLAVRHTPSSCCCAVFPACAIWSTVSTISVGSSISILSGPAAEKHRCMMAVQMLCMVGIIPLFNPCTVRTWHYYDQGYINHF